MRNDRIQEMYERVQAAEMVLVGLGESFQYDWNGLIEDARYHEIEQEINGNGEYIWITPFLQKMVLQRGVDDRWVHAYQNLRRIVDKKNYFVVSLCMDDYIYETGLDEARIVKPCGGFRKMQCDSNCSHVLCDIPLGSYEEVMKYYNKDLSLEDLQEPRCSKCGGKLRFNQLGVSNYAEEGYLDQWSEYTKWLQGTVNKSLCVLELGVGMEYPTVIRFPFEKILFYNQKAFMYRIHPVLYQLGEEIADRGIGIGEDPVDFLCDL